MTRRKNPATARPAAARSAAHAAPAPAPAPGTGPAPNSPAGAAYAALAAHPGGATTAVIAETIGIGRAAARDALTELETASTITRTKGGKPGIPDTWTLTTTEPTGHEPGDEHGPDGEPAAGSQPGDGRAAGDQASPGEPEAADSAGHQEASDDQVSTGRDPGNTAAAQAAVPDGSSGEPDTATEPEQGGTGSADHVEPSPGDSPADRDAGSADEPPYPALVPEITGRVEQIQAAAAAIVLTGGDLHAALAGMDEICEQAIRARRALKDAIGGKKAPAAKPGGLRDKILGHLRGHPGSSFTPHEIHKVLGNSSGAISNALDTLVKHGHAELATEKPRKFRLAGGTATPAEDHHHQAPAGPGHDTEQADAA